MSSDSSYFSPKKPTIRQSSSWKPIKGIHGQMQGFWQISHTFLSFGMTADPHAGCHSGSTYETDTHHME